MANDDFFDGLDEAEAKLEPNVIQETVEKKERARYWYEEGYEPPGNEKADEEPWQPDDEDTKFDVPDDIKDMVNEIDKDSDSDDSSASDTVYEEVKVTPGAAKGGHFKRWGGISGKLCLTDEQPEGTVAKLSEVLSELMLVPEESIVPARSLAIEDEKVREANEVTAIVLSQMPNDSKPWTFNHFGTLAIEDERLDEAYQDVRMKYNIEEALGEKAQVRTEEEPKLNYWMKKSEEVERQARMDLVQNIREEEKKKRSIEKGGREQLPGMRKPLAMSQEWQARKAESMKVEPKKGTGVSLLPCSMSSSSSWHPDASQGSLNAQLGVGHSEKMAVRRPALMREHNWMGPKAPGPKGRFSESVLRASPAAAAAESRAADTKNSGGPTPSFRTPVFKARAEDWGTQ